MDQNKIGKFIAECRKEKSLTQAALAEQLGITDRAVSKWERGKNMALHEFLWDSFLKLSHTFQLECPERPALRGHFAGIALAAIERAPLGWHSP